MHSRRCNMLRNIGLHMCGWGRANNNGQGPRLVHITWSTIWWWFHIDIVSVGHSVCCFQSPCLSLSLSLFRGVPTRSLARYLFLTFCSLTLSLSLRHSQTSFSMQTQKMVIKKLIKVKFKTDLKYSRIGWKICEQWSRGELMTAHDYDNDDDHSTQIY